MKRTGNVRRKPGLLSVALTLALVLGLGLFADSFAIVSRADSQAKVIANSANIRKEPSSTSEAIGSTEKDKIITIKSQVQGSDGYIWYQTFVNADTLGYIRSDLVQITDGSTPASVTPVESTTTPTTPANETTVEVTAVNPVSATVSGGSSVRVRSNASTTSQIVKTVSNGLAVTVTGTANGSDGKVWYQVNFSANNTETSGFIRSDYVSLSGDLTPYTEEPTQEEPIDNPEEPAPAPEPEEVKDFDTMQIDGTWYLIDNTKDAAEKHDIQGLFDKVTNNAAAYTKAEKTAKTEKVVIIILILLLVAAAAAIALLIFKLKDMLDDAYFSEVENETMRRRGTERPKSDFGKVMHTVGAERPSGARPTGTRVAGARPVGTPQGSAQGQRPMGARPAGTPQGSTQGQRPMGARPAGTPQGSAQGQRPMGARPAGAPQGSMQGQRPGGASQGSTQGQRPAGARPGGAPQGSAQGQRPMGARPAGAPQEGTQGQKPAGNQQGWQSKNFMADDDDEFEFEFLNYDGDEEQ